MVTAKQTTRSVVSIVDAVRTLEGGGFPVRRPFPTETLSDVDPFLLLDHLAPVAWGPGEAVGAPDHPHRGFETVTYMLEGQLQHKDSHGHIGNLGPGDVQWMTAGAGIVHSEMPEPEFHRSGGVWHGVQIWVNLPAKNKMIQPRYQDIPSSQIPEGSDAEGRVNVRVIAGEALGKSAVIDTRTPTMYLHFSLKSGGEVTQETPEDYNAFVYLISGEALIGADRTPVREGQLAILGQGARVPLATPTKASAPAELLLLGGTPLGEPIVRYGPFVMNTKAEIEQAITDYRLGRMGQIEG